MAYQSAEELSLEDLQRLYLGEGQYPHLAQQLDYTNPAYFIPPANSPSPNHPQDYSFSFPHQSISPSSTSAPIDCAAPTSSSGFDFNAYLDDDYQSGGGAYTPSYGSFSSQTSSFGSATGPSGSPFSNPSSYNERASSFDFPTSSQPFASSSTHFNPFEDHRDSRYDLGKEYQAASVGGGAAADRSLYEANAGAERQGGGMEFDLELNEMLNGGGMETGRPAETTLQATSEQGRHDTLSFTAGSYGHDDEGDYSRRSSIFPGTLTDSPPTTTVELSSVVARVSPILLAPLAIPTTLSPSLHLTQPTPATARPREKGAGTLELEHLLGELVNEERATQRSRSESDMRDGPPHHGHMASSQPSNQHFSSTPFNYPAPPPIQNPSSYWQPGGSYQFGYSAAAYGGEVEQHELGSRERSAPAMRRDVGPGYASGLAPPVDGGARRSRSQSHGHTRNSRSEDLSYGAFNGVVTSQDGHFALPGSRSPQQQPPSQPLPSHGFAPAPPPSAFPPPHLQPGNAYNDSQGVSTLAPPRTPYVYHSPVATPSPPAGDRSATPSGSEDGREKPVMYESRTTQATIQAAQRRRAPGTEAKFKCDLCGETFTRRYNLRGHQRAHRNEKPFACSYEGCEKAFARSHDCKRHELLHLGVRRYRCDPCQRDFVRLDALQRHHRSEVGQACVDRLRAAGFQIGYDTTVQSESVLL